MSLETVGILVTVLSVAVGLVGALVGWIATGIRGEIKDLWRANAMQSQQIAETSKQIAVLVAKMDTLSCLRSSGGGRQIICEENGRGS